jgi:hypothetical protein
MHQLMSDQGYRPPAKCPRCGQPKPEPRLRTHADGTRHIYLQCTKCKKAVGGRPLPKRLFQGVSLPAWEEPLSRRPSLGLLTGKAVTQ